MIHFLYLQYLHCFWGLRSLVLLFSHCTDADLADLATVLILEPALVQASMLLGFSWRAPSSAFLSVGVQECFFPAAERNQIPGDAPVPIIANLQLAWKCLDVPGTQQPRGKSMQLPCDVNSFFFQTQNRLPLEQSQFSRTARTL